MKESEDEEGDQPEPEEGEVAPPVETEPVEEPQREEEEEEEEKPPEKVITIPDDDDDFVPGRPPNTQQRAIQAKRGQSQAAPVEKKRKIIKIVTATPTVSKEGKYEIPEAERGGASEVGGADKTPRKETKKGPEAPSTLVEAAGPVSPAIQSPSISPPTEAKGGKARKLFDEPLDQPVTGKKRLTSKKKLKGEKTGKSKESTRIGTYIYMPGT